MDEWCCYISCGECLARGLAERECYEFWEDAGYDW